MDVVLTQDDSKPCAVRGPAAVRDHGAADPTTTAAICPGTDQRDLEAALEYLLDEGSIEGQTWRLESLVALAEGGLMALTELGQRQLVGDVA